MIKRIDYTSTDWVERVRARELRKRDLAKGKRAVTRVRSRAYMLSAEALGTIHNEQLGRCANVGCRAAIKATGRGRALDTISNKLLCKKCSIVLGILDRHLKRLDGLRQFICDYPAKGD